MKKTIHNLFTILLMIFVCFGLSAQDSKGTTFWTGLLSNQGDANNTLALYLVSDINTTATVTIPGLSFSSVVNLTGGVLTTVSLPSTAWASSYFTVLDRGIKVVANDPISVYSLNADAATTDASLVLPTDALGLDHYVMSYRTTLGGLPSNMLFVATEDNTTVTITTTVTTGGFTAGVPANVVLNEGQVYSLSGTGADSAADDLTGTRVQSDKPIAVIGGNECTQVPDGDTFCDHIYEQIQPNSTWGTTFITTPLSTRLNGDRFRILAQEASTEVSINGALVATLNAGEFYETVIEGASEVNATGPIMVSQFSHSTSYDGVLSDPFMLNVPPTDQFLASYIVGTVDMIFQPGSQVNYLNLTSPTSSTGSVTLDGNPVVGWAAVGASSFSHASVQVANGQHVVNSPLPVGLLVYGFSSVESYGYVGGQSFSPVATVNQLSLNVENTTSIQGQDKCVVATVLDSNNDPVVGVLVNFTVAGANVVSGFGNTDSNGEVTLCYNTCLAGTDILTATLAGLSDSATIVVAPSSLTVNPTSLNATPGVESCVTATVLDAGDNAVPNAQVTFSVAGSNTQGDFTGSTNAAGEIEFCYTPINAGSDVITITVGCVEGNSESVNVTVNSADCSGVLITTTYTAGSWDMGPPDIGYRAVIDSPLVTGGTSIVACECEVNASLTVQDGDYLRVNGDITVNGTLTVDHQGSVVQVDDNASVTNNGTITVEKITPFLEPRFFMISGSPMTAETREGVYANSRRVRRHVTANFVPNPDVAAAFPLANNFADDNGNNWFFHSGGINPGEGYAVWPQPNGSSSGSYTQNHTLGTLTNGVVDFPMTFNEPGPLPSDNQNASPNVLANPYASAIDADLFFDNPANANINVLYFWEHNTPALPSYPGYAARNWDMADISLYSESLGGLPAASGGDTPTQFISSGQGFGIKPSAGGTAQFNNSMRVNGPNNTYRNNNSANLDRIWINVHNDVYELGSTALIGFTENTADEFINSEDVKRLATPVSIYSELESGEQLAINALHTFEVEDTFYLSFSTQVEEIQDYRISIRDVDGLNLENTFIYLIDTLTGTVTNLTESDYIFQSEAATYGKRFEVVFEYAALGINGSNLDAVSLYPNPAQNVITIVSPRATVTSAIVYDTGGRKVSELDFRNKTTYQIDLSAMENAIYFIQIATENGTVMKQVIKR